MNWRASLVLCALSLLLLGCCGAFQYKDKPTSVLTPPNDNEYYGNVTLLLPDNALTFCGTREASKDELKDQQGVVDWAGKEYTRCADKNASLDVYGGIDGISVRITKVENKAHARDLQSKALLVAKAGTALGKVDDYLEGPSCASFNLYNRGITTYYYSCVVGNLNIGVIKTVGILSDFVPMTSNSTQTEEKDVENVMRAILDKLK